MPWLDFGITSLLLLFVVICLLLCLLILMQRTKNDGIGSAIASGVTQKYIGVQTSNVLVKGTVWLTVAFFLTSLLLDHLYTVRAKEVLEHKTSVYDKLSQPVPTPVPATIPKPTAAVTPSASTTAPTLVVPNAAVQPVPSPIAPAPGPVSARTTPPGNAATAPGKPTSAK